MSRCVETVERLLSGDVEPAIQEHLLHCASCRAADRVVTRLREAGEQGRAKDLSQQAVDDTRRRVAEVLSASRPRRREMLVFPGSREWRWALGACAALAFLAAALYSLGPLDPGTVGSSAPVAPSLPARDLAFELDAEIESGVRSLSGRLAGFERRHLTDGMAAPVDGIADALEDRIKANLAALKLELM